MRSLIVVIIGLVIGGYIYAEPSNQSPSTSRAIRATSVPAVAPTATFASPKRWNPAPIATAPVAFIVPTPSRLGCDPAYPEPRTCIPPGPPWNQGCGVTTQRLFKVLPPDPQGLDHDGDGIGCEPIGVAPQVPVVPTAPDVQYRECESSYPDVCIPSAPPDLSCDDVEYLWGYRDFIVYLPDTHGFDGDGDGWGCEPFYGQQAGSPDYDAQMQEQAERDREYQDYLEEQDARDDYYDDYYDDRYEDIDYCEAHRCVE